MYALNSSVLTVGYRVQRVPLRMKQARSPKASLGYSAC